MAHRYMIHFCDGRLSLKDDATLSLSLQMTIDNIALGIAILVVAPSSAQCQRQRQRQPAVSFHCFRSNFGLIGLECLAQGLLRGIFIVTRGRFRPLVLWPV